MPSVLYIFLEYIPVCSRISVYFTPGYAVCLCVYKKLKAVQQKIENKKKSDARKPK